MLTNNVRHSYEDHIASASSDGFVKIWHPHKGCLQTLSGHRDYVKALAQTRDHELMSGGLDRRLLVWDIEYRKCVIHCGEKGEVAKSIYTLHAESGANSTLVASGVGKDVVLWDVRTGCPAVSLRAHGDMVRCVRLRHDERVVLSGGSDNEIIMQDVRHQSVSSMYALHDDSVWALCPVDEWRSFYSGGRDGRVFRCDLQDDGSATLVKDRDAQMVNHCQDMVLSICAEPEDETSAWVSTTGSTIQRYSTQAQNSTPRSIRDVLGLACRGYTIAVGTTGTNMLGTMKTFPRVQKNDNEIVFDVEPTASINGEPGIIQAICLNDRRHIVTRDTSNVCKKFDVLTGQRVNTYNYGMNMKEILANEKIEVAISSWFACDLKNGALEVRVSAPFCFQAEAYSSDVGLQSPSMDDDRVNLGELFLNNVLHTWREMHQSCNSEVEREQKEYYTDSDIDEDSKRSLTLLKQLSEPFVEYAEVRIFQNEFANAVTRFRCDDVAAQREITLPDWITTAILRGCRKVKGLTPSVAKISFLLEPATDKDGKPGPKLTAPRFLRVGKVKDYVINQIGDEQRGKVHRENVNIWCNGVVLSDSMGIATCGQFIWRRFECLKLSYSIDQ